MGVIGAFDGPTEIHFSNLIKRGNHKEKSWSRKKTILKQLISTESINNVF